MFPFQATRIPRFRALCWRGSEGIAAAPVIAAAVFPEFVARCTAAAVPGLAEGRARKPQPEAQRRDRVRTRAQRCPAPAMAKAKSPGKAMNSGKTGNTAATAQGPQNPPRGERPSAAGRCLVASGHASEAITAGRPGGRDLQRQIRKATRPGRQAGPGLPGLSPSGEGGSRAGRPGCARRQRHVPAGRAATPLGERPARRATAASARRDCAQAVRVFPCAGLAGARGTTGVHISTG